MTDVYLAYSISGECRKTLAILKHKNKSKGLNLLVSYVYLEHYDRLRHSYPVPEKTMLDSGAYSAWKSGKTIDLSALIKETNTGRWDECVALDVIGDSEGSLRNSLAMQAAGSPAFPVFHYGDAWPLLDEYKRRFPKVGLSCRFGETITESHRWLERCFARAWPYKFHSFGYVKEEVLIRFPFHSADTASWNNRPCAYGAWCAYGGKMSIHGLKDLTKEVEFYLDLQSRLRWRWQKEMRMLDGLDAAGRQQGALSGT